MIADRVLHPHLRAALLAYRRAGGTRDAVAKALGVTVDMARRYEEGWTMPRKSKMVRLAALLNMDPAELEYGKLSTRVPGVVTIPLAEVTAEEQVLLEAYRKLPKHAREALRVHAARLLEQFAKPSATNPFGRHNQS